MLSFRSLCPWRARPQHSFLVSLHRDAQNVSMRTCDMGHLSNLCLQSAMCSFFLLTWWLSLLQGAALATHPLRLVWHRQDCASTRLSWYPSTANLCIHTNVCYPTRLYLLCLNCSQLISVNFIPLAICFNITNPTHSCTYDCFLYINLGQNVVAGYIKSQANLLQVYFILCQLHV